MFVLRVEELKSLVKLGVLFDLPVKYEVIEVCSKMKFVDQANGDQTHLVNTVRKIPLKWLKIEIKSYQTLLNVFISYIR